MTDQEMTVMEYIMRYPQLPTERDTPLQEDPHGEAPGLVRRQMDWERVMGKSLYFILHRKEGMRQGEQV